MAPASFAEQERKEELITVNWPNVTLLQIAPPVELEEQFLNRADSMMNVLLGKEVLVESGVREIERAPPCDVDVQEVKETEYLDEGDFVKITVLASAEMERGL